MDATTTIAQSRDFPGGPAAETPHSQSKGPGFDPWSQNQIPHATTKTQRRGRKEGRKEGRKGGREGGREGGRKEGRKEGRKKEFLKIKSLRAETDEPGLGCVPGTR